MRPGLPVCSGRTFVMSRSRPRRTSTLPLSPNDSIVLPVRRVDGREVSGVDVEQPAILAIRALPVVDAAVADRALRSRAPRFPFRSTRRRATIDRFLASRYITPSTTIGLNRYVRMSPVGKVQATSSFATFDLLICLSAEYWDESEPPRYWRQVSNFGLPFCWALTSAMLAGSRLATTNRRTRTRRFLCMGMCCVYWAPACVLRINCAK